MNFIDEVSNERQKLASAIKENPGIRNIVEELYPDRAHFIYELLQNAEDAGATESKFTLNNDSFNFEHNGSSFSQKDVWAITGIGEGTKADKEDKIGRFGVGFKSVFAYCETPYIWSPTFSFKISDLVLPTKLEPKYGDENTYFEFPFNNPKKQAQTAYQEIKVGLEELSETTLLFLSNLKVIRWQINEKYTGEIRRIKHSEHHIEMQKRMGNKSTSKSHFLRFSDAVDDGDKLCVSIAFKLKFLSNISSFNAKTPLNEQMEITRVKKGQVAVFFPAEKETSNLRFHLHGPFVPELSRASIKDTPLNEPLFEQIARLNASSLHTICDLKLLTNNFLGVLPNSKDEIPERYQPIWNAIMYEMNNEKLTPTYTKQYLPARQLLQSEASLKALLTEEDLELLVDYDEHPFKWAIEPKQKNNNVDNFLNDLATTNWDIEAFVKMVEEKTSETSHVLSNEVKHTNITNSKFMDWIANKSDEWHQELYTLLDTKLIDSVNMLDDFINYKQKSFSALDTLKGTNDTKIIKYIFKQNIELLKHLAIVRLHNGNYSTGSKCYFPNENIKHDESRPIVAIGVYSSGNNKNKQTKAKNYLKILGVREFGEEEKFEDFLKKRYTSKSLNPDMNDLNRFISFVENDPKNFELFADYSMLKRIDEEWVVPNKIFLDEPFLNTGLSTFYKIQDHPSRMALHPSYQNCGIPLEKIVNFVKNVGAQTHLKIETVPCTNNPDASKLIWSTHGNFSKTGINSDYMISGLKDIVEKQNEILSLLLWRTLCNDSNPSWITAQYRKNSRQKTISAPSQLVCIVRNAAWIPQTDGRFVRPCEASSNLLPNGFQFDEEQEWLRAVHFGEKVAKDLDFNQKSSEDEWFEGLTKQQKQYIQNEYKSRNDAILPDQEPTNPERRSKNVQEGADDAPERLTEKKNRSVSINRDAVVKEAKPYLRQQYTNADGQMICQVCKTSLPFKCSNGNYYFETVMFIREMNKYHYQNHLALCPKHAAMFKCANESRDLLKNSVIMTKNNEIEIVLAQKDSSIYFTKTHIADLKAVIKSEQQNNE